MKNNIKSARENKGFTQQECADIFGVKLRAWQTYEQGVSEPKYELLCKIADTFGVTTNYLLGREPLDNPLAGLNITVNDVPLIEEYKKFPDYMKQMFVEAMERLSSAAKQEQGKKRVTDRLGDLEDEQAKNADETSSA